ncbi:MAG: hypothetical protein AABZ31_03855 [Bdellovibrionota bacterium]
MFKQSLLDLKKDLIHFGLKPTEWRIMSSRKAVYVIHREDSGLLFKAQVALNSISGKLALTQLTLLDI